MLFPQLRLELLDLGEELLDRSMIRAPLSLALNTVVPLAPVGARLLW